MNKISRCHNERLFTSRQYWCIISGEKQILKVSITAAPNGNNTNKYPPNVAGVAKGGVTAQN